MVWPAFLFRIIDNICPHVLVAGQTVVYLQESQPAETHECLHPISVTAGHALRSCPPEKGVSDGPRGSKEMEITENDDSVTTLSFINM